MIRPMDFAFDDFLDDLIRFDPVPVEPISERFNVIAKNYKAMRDAVKRGEDSWADGDPYQIADWHRIFTPIEAAVWHDIRALGIPLWPQLPLRRFFLDFGDPVRRIAIECDGKQWHDPAKDRARDRELASIGWSVHRIPGSLCLHEGERGYPQRLLVDLYGTLQERQAREVA